MTGCGLEQDRQELVPRSGLGRCPLLLESVDLVQLSSTGHEVHLHKANASISLRVVDRAERLAVGTYFVQSNPSRPFGDLPSKVDDREDDDRETARQNKANRPHRQSPESVLEYQAAILTSTRKSPKCSSCPRGRRCTR